ncbi:unnamed protein product [Prunus brigantina]
MTKVGGLPSAEDVGKCKLYGSNLDDLLIEQEESSTKLPPSATGKSSSKGVSCVEKIPMGVAPYSSAGIKLHVSANNKNVNSTQELNSHLLEQRVLQLSKLPIRELVIALLVKFDTHVEATEAFKYEIVVNAYKLGHLDCRNGCPSCCPLGHEDGEHLYLDIAPAQSEQINVVDVEAVEEQVAGKAVMEEDNAKGGVAEEVRANAKEQAVGAVEQIVPVE